METLTRGIPDQHARPPVYVEPLSDTAIRIGEEKLCGDMEQLGDFIAGDDGERQWSYAFGQISVPELLQDFLLNPRAEPEQVMQAQEEFLRRLFWAKSEYVRREAEKAMEA